MGKHLAAHMGKDDPLGPEQRVGQQERNAAAVITAQVGEDDRIDRVMLNSQFVMSEQAGGVKIYREPNSGGINKKVCLKLITGARGITDADESNMQAHRSPHQPVRRCVITLGQVAASPPPLCV